MKKIISLILSVVLTLSVCVVGFSTVASAADTKAVEQSQAEAVMTEVASADFSAYSLNTANLGDTLLKLLYGVVDKLIDCVVGALNSVVPSVSFNDKDSFVNDQLSEGIAQYLSEPAQGAKWSLGYGSASLQTGNELDGEHFVGGSLSFPKTKAATAVYDDQRVRVIALNDGSGRGTVVFAVIDGFGISNETVREIRAELADFAKANNVVSINISVLHQHSCVDTYGMNGDLLKMIFVNPCLNIINNKFGTDKELLNGLNEEFMANLYKQTEQAIKDAVNSMTDGKMYYSEIDASDYIRDKRDPIVFDPYIHRIRFVPDNGERETWICNMAIHCVGNGAAGTEVTGDYPYYMEQVINSKADANFIELQGAELAITSNHDTLDTEDMTRLESLKVFGTALGNLVVDSNEKESEVAPLLNLKMSEYYIPISNTILEFAGRLGAVTNTVVTTGKCDKDLEVATEIGYMELGTDIAVALIPGELEPTIAYGGSLSASESWSGEDFDYPSLQEIVGSKKLLVFGLMNDQVGYILADNDFKSLLAGENEEIVATGKKAGSTTVEAFEALYNSIEK